MALDTSHIDYNSIEIMAALNEGSSLAVLSILPVMLLIFLILHIKKILFNVLLYEGYAAPKAPESPFKVPYPHMTRLSAHRLFSTIEFQCCECGVLTTDSYVVNRADGESMYCPHCAKAHAFLMDEVPF